jgi:hypothetical protein
VSTTCIKNAVVNCYLTKNTIPKSLEPLLAVAVDSSRVQNGGNLVELIPRAQSAVVLHARLGKTRTGFNVVFAL